MDFKYPGDEYKCEGRERVHFGGRVKLPGWQEVGLSLVTEISSLVREDLENECGVPLYCPILQPLGEEGPGKTEGCCLATRGASGSMGMAGGAPAPSPALSLFDLTQPSRNLGGMPGAACLIRAESIEGIFHNEIMWAAEAAVLASPVTLLVRRKRLVCLSSTQLPC